MNILILGGTGAMGLPLTKLLAPNNQVWVTSRSDRTSETPSVRFVKGNAKNENFLFEVAKSQSWDAIVDFMVRSVEELKEVLPVLLNNTKQYVFISSARVYAECEGLITEESPRLLDVSTDDKFLKTNEYSLAKAREEDIVRQMGKNNYTIVRPSITYNDYRLQLGVMEKEDFVYRILQGRTLVFSHDLENKLTTMTHGNDVARGIAALIGRTEALGEIFHITSPKALTWGEVLGIYKKVFEEHLGHPLQVKWTDETTNYKLTHQYYRIKYCRMFNRSFDNGKIAKFVDPNSFVPPEEGLTICLKNFLQHPKFNRKNWPIEGINDRVTGEHLQKGEINRMADRLWYTAYRYDLKWLVKLMKYLIKKRNS